MGTPRCRCVRCLGHRRLRPRLSLAGSQGRRELRKLRHGALLHLTQRQRLPGCDPQRAERRLGHPDGALQHLRLDGDPPSPVPALERPEPARAEPVPQLPVRRLEPARSCELSRPAAVRVPRRRRDEDAHSRDRCLRAVPRARPATARLGAGWGHLHALGRVLRLARLAAVGRCGLARLDRGARDPRLPLEDKALLRGPAGVVGRLLRVRGVPRGVLLRRGGAGDLLRRVGGAGTRGQASALAPRSSARRRRGPRGRRALVPVVVTRTTGRGRQPPRDVVRLPRRRCGLPRPSRRAGVLRAAHQGKCLVLPPRQLLRDGRLCRGHRARPGRGRSAALVAAPDGHRPGRDGRGHDVDLLPDQVVPCRVRPLETLERRHRADQADARDPRPAPRRAVGLGARDSASRGASVAC